jgi:hypothetical protein
LLVCIYALAAVRRQQLTSRAEALIANVREAGLPVLPGDVPGWLRGPEVRESASVILRQASRTFSTTTRPLYLPDAAAQWHSRGRLPPELKQSLSRWIAGHAELFRMLEELTSRKPGGGISGDRYRTQVMTEDLIRILQIKARVEMEDDPNAAAQTITALLHCLRALQGEHLVTFVGTGKGMSSAKELLGILLRKIGALGKQFCSK